MIGLNDLLLIEQDDTGEPDKALEGFLLSFCNELQI